MLLSNLKTQHFHFELQKVDIGFSNQILIQNIDFKIKRGEKILLLGANGSGKTTFLKVLLKLEKPLRGKILYNFKKISYVPQLSARKGEFLITVKQYLQFFMSPTTSFWFQNSNEKMVYLLKRMNLYEKKDILIRECSGGEFQRLNIARALLNQPEVLILDEPLNAIDIENRKSFLELLKEIYEEYQITVIMTSHYLNEDIIHFFSRKLMISQNQLREV